MKKLCSFILIVFSLCDGFQMPIESILRSSSLTSKHLLTRRSSSPNNYLDSLASSFDSRTWNDAQAPQSSLSSTGRTISAQTEVDDEEAFQINERFFPDTFSTGQASIQMNNYNYGPPPMEVLTKRNIQDPVPNPGSRTSLSTPPPPTTTTTMTATNGPSSSSSYFGTVQTNGESSSGHFGTVTETTSPYNFGPPPLGTFASPTTPMMEANPSSITSGKNSNGQSVGITTTSQSSYLDSLSRQKPIANMVEPPQISQEPLGSMYSSPTALRTPIATYNNINGGMYTTETSKHQEESQQSPGTTVAPQEHAPSTNGDDTKKPNMISDEEQELQDLYLRLLSNEVQYKKLLGENPYSWTDIQVDILWERLLDQIEDGFQKSNGKTKGQSKYKWRSEPAPNRPTVIVLGTGWAAHAFVKLASTYDLRIVVVSPVNHFVFTPMLASAAVGTVEYRSMTEPIRVTNPFIDNYVEGRAIGIDVLQKKVTVQLTSLSTVTGAFRGIAALAPDRLEPEEPPLPADGKGGSTDDARKIIELTYDTLICSVGTNVRSGIVPGAKQHCFNLKTAQDSKRLRTAIGEALEFASRPDVQESYYPGDSYMQRHANLERQRRVRFVIVGGGPTGVELAGELSDFFAQVCRRPDGAYQHLAQDISIILIHGGPEVVPMMDPPLRERALAKLQSLGIDVCLNTRLKEVGRDFVRIGEKGSTEEETISVGLTVWAAGNAPVPFVQQLLSQLPPEAAGSGGRIVVDRWLRCPTPTLRTFGSILVLGDAACLEAKSKYDDDASALPQTAQVAGQQGEFTARMLNRGYLLQTTPPRLPPPSEDDISALRIWLSARGLEEAPPFTFLSLGLLAYVGGGEALNQVSLGDVPIFNYAGKIAFALWRSVYLSKQAATRNQALIAFDWLRTELFGRDITRL